MKKANDLAGNVQPLERRAVYVIPLTQKKHTKSMQTNVKIHFTAETNASTEPLYVPTVCIIDKAFHFNLPF